MSRWTWVATAVAGAALVGCSSGGDTAATPGDDTAGQRATMEVLELTLPAASSGRCMAPSVENLLAQDAAFEGTVTDVVDGTATLEVADMYTGSEVDTVTVTTAAQDLSGLVPTVDFQPGRTYLVSSIDGQVSMCGLSGPKDEMLTSLYQEAYGD